MALKSGFFVEIGGFSVEKAFSEKPNLTANLTSDVYLGKIGNTQHIVVLPFGFFLGVF